MEPAPLPTILFPGKLHLIQTDQELLQIGPLLVAATEFGFDTETKPSFKKGQVHKVSLLQLATDNEAYLIRLQGLTQFEVIKAVFENKDILKVGAAIRDDLRQLQLLFKFKPENFIELQEVAKKKGLQNFGLKGMTEEVLRSRLSKGPKLTNWELPTLTEAQLMYAATDAWIGLTLFKKLSQLSD